MSDKICPLARIGTTAGLLANTKMGETVAIKDARDMAACTESDCAWWDEREYGHTIDPGTRRTVAFGKCAILSIAKNSG